MQKQTIGLPKRKNDMASYHIQVKGKQLGPFKPTEIKLLVEKGKIGPMDFIRTEGQTNWIQADKVKGLDFSNRPILVKESLLWSLRTCLKSVITRCIQGFFAKSCNL